MWKLWHHLFGWDYVAFDFAFDKKIRRVRYTLNGRQYVKCYGLSFLSELRNVTWLT